MGKDVNIACATAKDPKDLKRKTLAKEPEEENLLKQCIEKLKLASRVVLVSQLKEALHEQESELENVRTQMQVAQAYVEEASNVQKRLDNEDSLQKASTATTLATDINANSELATRKSTAAIAAEVADKVAASSSSQLIMTSILSTFADEEANTAGLSSESTPKVEKPMPASDPDVFMSTKQLIATPSFSYPSVLVPQPTMENQAPVSQGYHVLCNPSSQQYVQSTGGIISPYGYGNIPLLPPGLPPPPPNTVGPMVPLIHQTGQITQHQPIPVTQQAPAPPSFRLVKLTGMVYYGNH